MAECDGPACMDSVTPGAAWATLQPPGVDGPRTWCSYPCFSAWLDGHLAAHPEQAPASAAPPPEPAA